MERPIVNVVATGTTRDYDAQYKIKVLKANIPFADQVTDENTKYIIRWDFDLNDEKVEIPSNCILQFEGGSINNGVLYTNHAKVINLTPECINDVQLIGYFYNMSGRRLSNKTFQPHNGKLNVVFPFEPYSFEHFEKWGLNCLNCEVVNGQIIYKLKYDNVNKRCEAVSYFSYVLNTMSVENVVAEIKKYGIDIFSLKFHKEEGFSNNPDADEMQAYYDYLTQKVDEYKRYTDDVKCVFISNEERVKVETGSPWHQTHLDIIANLQSKGYKVGISCNSIPAYFANIDTGITDALDIIGINHYPTISTKRLNTQFSDIPQMIVWQTDALAEKMGHIFRKAPTKEICISESGVPGDTEMGLEFPYNTSTIVRTGETDTEGKLKAIYHRTVSTSVRNCGISLYIIWFASTAFLRTETIAEAFYDIQFK